MVRDLGELGINLQKILTRLYANQNLLKLLYYTDKDPLSQADLTDTQIKEEIFDKFIKIVPRIGPKETANSIVSLRVERAATNSSNSEFRVITLKIEVFVPLTQWYIKDSNLRPFCILSEVQKSINNKVINGLGRIQGGTFSLNFITEEISCYEAEYNITDYE